MAKKFLQYLLKASHSKTISDTPKKLQGFPIPSNTTLHIMDKAFWHLSIQSMNPYFRYMDLFAVMWEYWYPGKANNGPMLIACWITKPLKMKRGISLAVIARNLSKLSFMSLAMKKFTQKKSLLNVYNAGLSSGIVIKWKNIKSPEPVWNLFHVFFVA